MNNVAPIQEPAGEKWSPGWVGWFGQLFDCLPWKKAWNYRFEIDFTTVSAHAESTGFQVPITGVRPGDSVQITPFSNTAGITHKGVVVADDTVIIYAINFTAGAINPATMFYRVIVTQN